ncbi:MAG: cyclic nucleotide-binding domain-containing protein [Planctomycetota bacterium]|jgi:CRP-like cAMP-binding protein|nr:cyclic nucleotide-binding domain-containing protein [Planctomycetota bacterium]MDP7253879.1 cyclic nucleotide-binding domain-containing protein [Planctomycetota bacterium]
MSDQESNTVGDHPEELPVAEILEEVESDATGEAPRLLEGTECVEVQDDEDSTHFLLRNRNEGAYVRIDEREYFLWQQMDGHTTLGELVESYFDQYHALGYDRVGKFLHKLIDHGFLDLESVALWHSENRLADDEAKPEGISSWLQRLAFQPVGPNFGDRFFKVLDDLGFGFLGQTIALRCMAAGGILGLLLFAFTLSAHGSEHLYQAFKPAGYFSLAFVGVYGWLIIGSVVHEFARAAALKANNCKVVKSGIAFHMGVPGVYVDTRDCLARPRAQRRRVILSGIWAEMFLFGLCGIASGMLGSAIWQQLMSLGTVIIGLRLIYHACPFVDSPAYEAVVESCDLPQLRRAALRFLRPDYWLHVWHKEEWEKREQVFFAFGIWSLVWGAVVAQVAAFLLNSQLSKTIIQLADKAFGDANAMSADETVALFMILIVLLPLLGFLVAGGSYIVSSLVDALNRSSIWRTPSQAVRWVVVVGLCAGLLHRLTAGSTSHMFIRMLLVMCGVYLADRLMFATKDELNDVLAGSLGRGHTCAAAGAALSLTGILLQGADIVAWTFLLPVGFVASLLGILFTAGVMIRLKSTRFAGLWYLVLLSLILQTVFTFVLVKTADAGGVFSSILIAACCATLLASRGWWLMVKAQDLHIPHLDTEGSDNEKQQLGEATGYVVTSLVRNLQPFADSDSIKKQIERMVAASSDELRLVHSEQDEAATFTCEIREDADLPRAAESVGSALASVLDEEKETVGLNAATRLLDAIQSHLPWSERQLVKDCLFAGTRWEKLFAVNENITHADRLTTLKNSFLFNRFDPDELATIASLVGSSTFEPGTNIIKQDEPGDEAYIIQQGVVDVLVEDELGETHSVAHLSAGDFFGELALLEDAPRSATVKAVDHVDVLILDRPVFDRFVESFGEARDKLANAIRALRLIHEIPLFDDFSQEEVATVATQFQVESFKSGEEVIGFGEMGDKFYVIQSGQADVLLPDSDEPIRNLKTRDFFGEIALLEDVPRTASIRATEDMTALSLGKGDFLQLVGGNPFARKRLSSISRQRTHELMEAL